YVRSNLNNRALARLEAEVDLTTLLRRLPGLRLAMSVEELYSPGTAVPQSRVASGRLVGLYASRLQVLHAPIASGTTVHAITPRAAAESDIAMVGLPSKRADGARRSVA